MAAMSGKERWACYFRYFADKTRKDLQIQEMRQMLKDMGLFKG
ncbi:hypothetical protein TREAZ_2402 [Leadbettera azotonutricia ZAS-9]|uniref:Uncharacterized protein n=1 Tax=Leadbettera azotonutricia (strain ATCC BAA-888 / DSM 13862 / ZAS-9) TaxID=545695 RepID=F5YGB6_LEAAZ|nr:hypothetical protein TREAZ_2402 [Leadbettera azotonutricia ZAS-9]